MKLSIATTAIALIALQSSEAFAPNAGGRSIAHHTGSVLPTSIAVNQKNTVHFGASNDVNTQDEVEMLRNKARQLREEANELAKEQARKVAESAKKVFEKFDLNKDGSITVSELKQGLQKSMKTEIPESRIKKLVDFFDKNGDGKLQLNEFVSEDKLRNQLDFLIREEKALELVNSKQVRQAQEAEKLKETLMSIINEDEPTTSDKILSTVPYLLPLLESLQFAAFFAVKNPDNPLAQAAAVAYGVYRSIPLGGFISFVALAYLSTNPTLNRLVRFNMQQAIFLDIALFVPGFLSFLLGLVAAANSSLAPPPEALEYGSDAVVLAMLGSVTYASVSSLLGKTPDKLPIVSQAAKDRTITREMFENVGQFMGGKSDDKDENILGAILPVNQLTHELLTVKNTKLMTLIRSRYRELSQTRWILNPKVNLGGEGHDLSSVQT
eukprot:scaffold5247_cov130-Cylindrotheca_fusiformis.AAC.14